MEIKILELTNFSSGICGVWQRVKQEAVELVNRGYEVKVFSSNITKGSEEIASLEDKIEGIKIRRFQAKKLGGESFMFWNFEKEALSYSPDVIIAHSYRHPHTLRALKIAKKLRSQGKKCRVFLVTHAPFVEENTRSFFSKLGVFFYDYFIGPRIINEFDKIVAITKWEIPYLLRLGAKKEKIVHIPNGIPNEFFKTRPKNGENILFLGRIAPIKNLEILIKAIKDLNIKLDIVGPAEENYKRKLLDLTEKEKIKNVTFFQAVYDLTKKIEIIDRHDIFVLPSKREAMPQSLIEAMARGKIVISSDTNGGKEIVTDGKNGFLFKNGNKKDLTEKINLALKKNKKLNAVRKNALLSVDKLSWGNLIKKLIKILNENTNT